MTPIEKAVMYALECGCFFPVPTPKPNASTQTLVKWGAMRNLHRAIAEHDRMDKARKAVQP